MNILYYLEPSIELNDNLFRFGTLKSILLPEILALKTANKDNHITLIVNNFLYEKISSVVGNDSVELIDKVVLVSDAELSEISNNNSFKLSMIWQNKKYSSTLLNKYKKFYQEKMGKDYQPEIVISYESPVPFLKELYPESLVLNAMFGAFSRAPFPSLFTLDDKGIFSNSTQALLGKSDICGLSLEEEKVLNIFRRESTKILAQNLPCKKIINEISAKYKAVILFACQVDQYFAYNSCIDSKTQFEVLEELLNKTPNNIGIVVTSHGYKKPFKEEEISLLEKKYSNLILLDLNVSGLSQYLIPYFDGVITVSSSLGYQASLWRKPLYVCGKSQINILATNEDYGEFLNTVIKKESIDQDKFLYYLIAHFNYSYRSDVFKNPLKYESILSDMLDNHKQGYNINSYRKTPEEVNQILNSDFRGWLLKEESKKYKDLIEPDYLRISISESRVASFDLFDTLVERDFREPHELFLFIEPQVRDLLNNKNFMFHYFRRQAEADVRRPTKGVFEVTLDQTYDKFSEITGIDQVIVNKIKKLEVQAELGLIHPKKHMIRDYNFSRMLLDKVSIISDIYLDEMTIKSILNKNNILYDSLWVSAETKTRKHNGTIFPEYISWVNENYPNLKAERMLHVGDNQIADGDMPKSYGMKVYTFPKAIDNLKVSLIGKNYFNKLHVFGGINSSIYSGIIANKFYSSQFNYIRKDNYFNADIFEYGYAAIGPLVFSFVKWLYHRAKLQKNINIIFFSKRWLVA